MDTGVAEFRERVPYVVGEVYWTRPPAIFDFLECHGAFFQYARFFTSASDVEGYRVMLQCLLERGDIDRVDDPLNYYDQSYLQDARTG